mgnify:CR=1 FL=1
MIEDKFGKKTFMNEGVSFFDACVDSDDIEVFDVENMKEYLDFKWDSFARSK